MGQPDLIYLPQTERQSHYFDARLASEFDAVIHFDETTALELERYPKWEGGEPPQNISDRDLGGAYANTRDTTN